MALPNLGPVMSLSDTTYTTGPGYVAGASEACPYSDCPGFDPAMLQSDAALCGRWVRSPRKFVGWDIYMEFFGLKGDKALQETEEPQEHVITAFSKTQVSIIHRLCWRDGLDCEYTVPIDGSAQPIPPAMVARASSSWKVNDLMNWVHAWDHGDDGNPLHRGLRTEQKLSIGGTDYTLRYWRNLIAPQEMRVNVEVTYADTGKYAVHTQRFFRKIDVDPMYSLACVSRPTSDLFKSVETWTHAGRMVRIVVMPHASNMPKDWEALGSEEQWNLAEEFPSAGRSSGTFLHGLRQEAINARLWICCGVVFRASRDDKPHALERGVVLIGADGWLHGVHVDAVAPPGSPFVAGAGDWPATQRARPRGVYDTELGRIGLSCSVPDAAASAEFVAMGAELVLAPPDKEAAPSRTAITLKLNQRHAAYTKYELCGPEPLPHPTTPDESWELVTVGGNENGAVQAETKQLPVWRSGTRTDGYEGAEKK